MCDTTTEPWQHKHGDLKNISCCILQMFRNPIPTIAIYVLLILGLLLSLPQLEQYKWSNTVRSQYICVTRLQWVKQYFGSRDNTLQIRQKRNNSSIRLPLPKLYIPITPFGGSRTHSLMVDMRRYFLKSWWWRPPRLVWVGHANRIVIW